jgi:glucosamine-6-phosphate deaminase
MDGGLMEVIVLPGAAEIGRLAADVVERVLKVRPEPVLGLATGSTPEPTYAELIRRHREEGLSFAHARAFTLDEYVGLPDDHPERYAAVIRRGLTDHVDLKPDAVQGPDGSAADRVVDDAATPIRYAADGVQLIYWAPLAPIIVPILFLAHAKDH